MVFDGGASQYPQDAILDSEDMRKLFVTKIPVDANDEDVKSFLESKAGGQVTEHVVIHKENARSHFGFFTFAHSSMIDEVIFKEKELIFNNSTLEVNRAVPKEHYLTGAHHKAKKLFIANLPKTGVSEDEMKKYFEDRHNPRYGIIEKVEFIKKKDEAGNRLEENKGFGFITVSSEHFADTLAIQYAKFDFGGQRIELKKSDKENTAQGGRGGGGRGRGGGARGGNRGGGQYGASGSGYGGYGGYDSYGYDAYNSGYNQWDYYGGYDMTYPQYGVSSSQTGGSRGGGMSERGSSRGGGRGGAKTERGGGRGGRGGKSDRGSSRGGGGGARGGQRGGKRFAPYSKMR